MLTCVGDGSSPESGPPVNSAIATSIVIFRATDICHANPDARIGMGMFYSLVRPFVGAVGGGAIAGKRRGESSTGRASDLGWTPSVDETESETAENERWDASDERAERSPATTGTEAALLTNAALADALPVCVFVLGVDREVRCWNRAIEALTGTPREAVLGTDEVSVAFYQDGRRSKTLADKVVEAPESADRVFGVNRSTDVSYTRYEDTSTMLNASQREVEIWFTATPVYDDDGELLGVVEMVQDRSDVVTKQRAIEGLVTEVNETLDRIGDGHLSARASFEDSEDVLDDQLLGIVTRINDMATSLETVVEQVRSRTNELAGQIEETASVADDIKRTASDQHDDMGTVVDEM